MLCGVSVQIEDQPYTVKKKTSLFPVIPCFGHLRTPFAGSWGQGMTVQGRSAFLLNKMRDNNQEKAQVGAEVRIHSTVTHTTSQGQDVKPKNYQSVPINQKLLQVTGFPSAAVPDPDQRHHTPPSLATSLMSPPREPFSQVHLRSSLLTLVSEKMATS